MERFIINPKNYQENYIKNLNQSFTGWGGSREYQWSFRRLVGEYPSDILLIENEEDGIIAGSAVSYRKLEGKNFNHGIGIMTGSWTLPAARRKGCFTKMIECSSELCKKKDIPFLTAFVTASNASSRRLESAGSFLFPTYYLFSPREKYSGMQTSEIKILSPDEHLKRKIFDTLKERQAGFINFSYSFDEFCLQYINRIKETTILKVNDDYAILEDGVEEIKILLLTYENEHAFETNIKLVTNWCLEHESQRTFFFTTRNSLYRSCKSLNFDEMEGYFTILNTKGGDIKYQQMFNNLNINMADKM